MLSKQNRQTRRYSDFSKIPFTILVIFILLLLNYPCFSQESEDPTGASKWYYSRRAYPYDTIPAGAFANAIAQRYSLLQNTGYQFPLSDPWEQIGPMPLNYNLGDAGRIQQVLYDPDPQNLYNGNAIYVMGEAGGLWKTTDGGLSWENKSGRPPNDLPTLSGGAFAIFYDVNNNKRLYFGTGDRSFRNGFGGSLGIFKSIDDGTSWTAINNGLQPGTSVNKIVISPNDLTGNTIFAATYFGLYKTANGGASWTKIIPQNPSTNLICNDICFSPNGSTVYAVGPTQGGRPHPWDIFGDGIGYWRSDDGGNSFNPIRATNFPHDNVIIDKTLCSVSKRSTDEGLVWFITMDEFPNPPRWN